MWEDEYLERETTECKTGWVSVCETEHVIECKSAKKLVCEKYEPPEKCQQVSEGGCSEYPVERCTKKPENECSTEYKKVPVRVSRRIPKTVCDEYDHDDE